MTIKILTLLKKEEMTYSDKHIVETYSTMFDGLSPLSKIELIESLSKSLKAGERIKESKFYKSFGAFASNKPVKEIIKEIKSSRKFRNKEIKL